MKSVAAFQRASIQSLARLARQAEEQFLPAGPLSSFPGGKGRQLFVVARGVVKLERSAPRSLARFGPRTVVGGLPSALDDGPLARLTAITPVVLLALRLEDLLDVMEDHFDLSRSIMRHLTSERERLMLLKSPAGAGPP